MEYNYKLIIQDRLCRICKSQIFILHVCIAQACNILIELTVYECFLLDIAASKHLEPRHTYVIVLSISQSQKVSIGEYTK